MVQSDTSGDGTNDESEDNVPPDVAEVELRGSEKRNFGTELVEEVAADAGVSESALLKAAVLCTRAHEQDVLSFSDTIVSVSEHRTVVTDSSPGIPTMMVGDLYGPVDTLFSRICHQDQHRVRTNQDRKLASVTHPLVMPGDHREVVAEHQIAERGLEDAVECWSALADGESREVSEWTDGPAAVLNDGTEVPLPETVPYRTLSYSQGVDTTVVWPFIGGYRVRKWSTGHPDADKAGTVTIDSRMD